ncbi:vitamin B12/bleomycin/antimicrobial peptide transport system ATP-binding/permease protein [uncultured Gammaproteobacteria bacterium]
MRASLKSFLGDSWVLARPYWVSEERWPARGLLAAVIGLNLALVYLNVLFNDWNNLFYNAMQDKDIEAFWHQLFRFSWLAFLFIATAVYQLYLTQMLQIRWRRWLTERTLAEFLADHTYYRFQFLGQATDNPDQRIAEDLRLFVYYTLDLSLGLLSSVVTLVSFVTILWGLSGSLAFSLGGFDIEIPGYMVWVALVYSAAGTWLTHVVGRSLAGLNFNQQRYEADFRFSLVRLRENAEGVALYRGEQRERDHLSARFAQVVTNWWGIMRCRKRLTWFTSGYTQVAIIFPFLVSAPRYFSGAIQLGGVMQISSAFGQVQTALSWFVEAYVNVAEWRAAVTRLTSFHAAIATIRAAGTLNPAITVETGPDQNLGLHALRLDLPGGGSLVEPGTLTIEPGQWLLITGPSGSGKSTLFRAIAGLWPFGCGRITLPQTKRVLFLPQKPYLPIGPLRAAVAFPTAAEQFSDAALAEALTVCGLPALVDRLDESDHWALRLSPGEQQRLAFARAVLHRPDWLFLDEATAACDAATEARLYTVVRERLPTTMVVSIGHRAALAEWHGRSLTWGQ